MQLTNLQAQKILVLWLLLTAKTTADSDLTAAQTTAINNAVAGVPGAQDLFAAYIKPDNINNLEDRTAVSNKLNTFLNSSDGGWGGPECPRSVQVIINMFNNLPG